jgi:prevent-host-death family protein
MPAFAGVTRGGFVTTITLTELLSHFDDMLDRAENGEEFVIVHDGRETARLLPARHYEDVPLPLRGFGQ